MCCHHPGPTRCRILDTEAGIRDSSPLRDVCCQLRGHRVLQDIVNGQLRGDGTAFRESRSQGLGGRELMGRGLDKPPRQVVTLSTSLFALDR